jgi:uncharacterized protein
VIILNIIEIEKGNYKDYRLIEGFPSPNLTATITTKYLIETLKMQEIGYFESSELVPVIRINNGLPKSPIRIYANHKKKLLAILSDQIIPNNVIKEYCSTLLDWSKKKKIKGIFTVASVKSAEPSKKVFAVTNNEKGLKFLKSHNIELVKEGLTSGLSAQLFLQEKNLPVYLILGGVSYKTSYEVASRILDTTNKMFDLKIDTKPLLEQSERLIKEVKENFKEVERSKEEPKQIMYS